MEADLQHHYSIDLADHWRSDPATGRRRLTLRRLYVLITHLPPDSNVAEATMPDVVHLSTTDVMLAGVYHALVGKPHPLVEMAKSALADLPNPDRERKVVDARRRAARRRHDIAAGRIT